MRMETRVISQKELILFKCIPRKQAWDDVLSIFWGEGEREESRNLRQKSETFEKNWGKRIKILHQQKGT